MTRILQHVVADVGGDVRELIVTRQSMIPAHVSEVRPTVEELIENYAIDETVAEPQPRTIGIFDDLLTAGSHFVAAKRVLSARFPLIPIIGIFIARRIFPLGAAE